MRKLKRNAERKKDTVTVYEKQKCNWMNRFGKQCKRNSVGKGTLCEKHGGERIVLENLISVYDSAVVVQKFNPAVHPIQFIELSREGNSLVEIASEMEVSVSLLKKWSENFKEFNVAFEIGEAMHEAWWLQQGKDNLTNTRFQTTLYKFLTTNKLGYAEKIETKSHNINENVGVLLIPGQMSVEEWENKNKEDDKDIIDVDFKKV
jgi:hypothetical protein